MYKYHCLNPISQVGLDQLTEEYTPVNEAKEADAILVRSAVMHEMEFSKDLKAVTGFGWILPSRSKDLRRRGAALF